MVLYTAWGCPEWTESPQFYVQKRDQTMLGPFHPYAWDLIKDRRPSYGATWYTRIAGVESIEDGDILISYHFGRFHAGDCGSRNIATTTCYTATWPPPKVVDE